MTDTERARVFIDRLRDPARTPDDAAVSLEAEFTAVRAEAPLEALTEAAYTARFALIRRPVEVLSYEQEKSVLREAIALAIEALHNRGNP